MRQLVLQHSIKKSTKQCANEHDAYAPEARAKQNVYRARAGTYKPPAKAEEDAAHNVVGKAFVLIGDNDRLSGNVLHVAALDELHPDKPGHYSYANDAVHVERLEVEHFINAVPGYGFRFGQYDPENQAYE